MSRWKLRRNGYILAVGLIVYKRIILS
jgi:hypothetical protein